jgi:hypothetical protein
MVFKSLAGRARDVDDAVTLLTLYPTIDVTEVRRRVDELAALADAAPQEALTARRSGAAHFTNSSVWPG